MRQPTCLVNGVRSAGVPVDDRGLHYGDGLFETIAIDNGTPLCLAQHMTRLRSGCERLGIAFPPLQQLVSEIRSLGAGKAWGVCKVIVTRAAGTRGYRPTVAGPGQRIVLFYPAGSAPDGAPINIRVCETRLSQNPATAGLKHLNRLEQVLASSEWNDPDIAEGLMLDAEGRVIEGTMSNVFGVRGGVLLTPDLSRCGVAGIVRAQVLELAEQITQRQVEIHDYTLKELLECDEIFLCNTTREIAAVRQVGDREYLPGPVTEVLRDAVHKLRRPQSGPDSGAESGQ